MTAQAIATESLNRAVSSQSIMNYSPIIAGFMAMGIAPEDIKPRENVFTYNAWRALGRQVSKGQHGVKVTTFVPVKGKKATEETPGKDDYRMPRTVTVFHVSQTEPIQKGCDCTPTAVNGEDIHDLTCSMFDGLPLSQNFEQAAAAEVLPAEQIEAIDQQTVAFVRARMAGIPVSFRYVDGTHETFNA